MLATCLLKLHDCDDACATGAVRRPAESVPEDLHAAAGHGAGKPRGAGPTLRPPGHAAV